MLLIIFYPIDEWNETHSIVFLQQIDGEAFLLLNQSDIVNILKIKLGPALKIYYTIPKFWYTLLTY